MPTARSCLRLPGHGSLYLVPALLCIVLPAALRADGFTRLVSYTSAVDGSQQEYGAYVPDGAPPPGGYPVVMHAHGYGWSVGTGFSQWARDWADARGWMLVQLNARGPNFYWGIGDVATREVVEDLRSRFGIDPLRVYITGGSMGGTGAFRQGVAHPEYIAAAVGVDGWTDFREWHWHWYARKDQRDEIEEFRRPLLEAASPLYWTERARWGDVYVIADWRDDVVLPRQGVDLAESLQGHALQYPGQYETGITINRDKGHGGGYDLNWIYNYFLGRAARPEQAAISLATPTLQHGELYWARMDAFHYEGQKATLEVTCSRRDQTGIVDVVTGNLDGFTLQLPAGPIGDCLWLRVYVDGIPAYTGETQSLCFEAVWDAEDALTGWDSYAAAEASPAKAAPARGFSKTTQSCGPLGHAFLSPFVVCYGTLGPAADVARHRAEAQAFCDGWNGFNVHGPGLVAVPEEELTSADLDKHLVLYGTLETSRMLRRAHELHPLPVEVHRDGVLVRDALTGDRHYRGADFGAYMIYPNALTDGRTYLVVCNGRYPTQPDGSGVQGLEFDLEKLSYGYSDYVVFNSSLPHVMNVNNKPPVTCYEAAYFVEAGYFDANWRMDRSITVDRVKRQQPPGVRLIHVEGVRVEWTDQSLPMFTAVDGEPQDPPRTQLPEPVLAACVKIIDAAGQPVRQARVTGFWQGLRGDALSRVTLSDGTAYFPCPDERPIWEVPRFTVLNVMATGAAYDYCADALEAGLWADDQARLAVRPGPLRLRVDQTLGASPAVEVANLGTQPAEVSARLVPPGGEVTKRPVPRHLAPGEVALMQFRWLPSGLLPAGRYRVPVEVCCGPATVTRTLELQVPPPRRLDVVLGVVAARDIVAGEPYEVTATIHNQDPCRELVLAAACTIIEPGRHPREQEVRIAPNGAEKLTWRPEADEVPLERGEYTARVSVLCVSGVSGTAGFAVR